MLESADAQGQSGHAHGKLLFAAGIERLDESGFEDAEEFVGDFGLSPKEALEVLDPLEVGDDDATGIAENIRDKEDVIPLIDHQIRFGSGGPVGCFREDATLNL